MRIGLHKLEVVTFKETQKPLLSTSSNVIMLYTTKGFFIILFENILFLKESCARNGCLWLLTKTRRSLGLAFNTYLCMIFQQQCSLLNTLPIEKVSMSHFFSFSRYQTKKVITLLLKQLTKP